MISRTLGSTFIFMAIWGSWAYYSNLQHGANSAVDAAITQSVFTTINTLLFTSSMEFLYSKNKLKLAYILPNTVATIALATAHIIRETPNLVATITPVLLVAYVSSYLYINKVIPKKSNFTGV